MNADDNILIKNYIINAKEKRLYCKYWNEDLQNTNKSIKSLLFIVHGMSEHCSRYEDVAVKLRDSLHESFVFSHDHQGHGRSEGDRVMIDDFDDYIVDIVQHVKLIQTKYPNAPLYLITHSLGGLIGIRAILQHPDLFSGLVNISPSLFIHPEDRPAWKVLLVRWISRIAPWMPVAKNDPKKHARRNKKVDDDYEADDLVFHGYMKAGWAIQFFDALSSTVNRFSEIKIPVFSIHGDDDNICPIEGSQALHNEISSKIQKLKIVEGAYHELHTEPDGVGVSCVQDIIDWLSNRIDEDLKNPNTMLASEDVNSRPKSDAACVEDLQLDISESSWDAKVVLEMELNADTKEQ